MVIANSDRPLPFCTLERKNHHLISALDETICAWSSGEKDLTQVLAWVLARADAHGNTSHAMSTLYGIWKGTLEWQLTYLTFAPGVPLFSPWNGALVR